MEKIFNYWLLLYYLSFPQFSTLEEENVPRYNIDQVQQIGCMLCVSALGPPSIFGTSGPGITRELARAATQHWLRWHPGPYMEDALSRHGMSKKTVTWGRGRIRQKVGLPVVCTRVGQSRDFILPVNCKGKYYIPLLPNEEDFEAQAYI